MSTRNTLIRSATLVTLLIFASCTEKTTIVQNVIPGDPVVLNGMVRGWRCYVCDVWNNRGVDPRFSVETGDTARVIILYANGWQDTVLTDSVSAFQRVVGAGLYRIIVETRYSYPDTTQVYLDHDTSIILDIVYGVIEPDTMVAVFSYCPAPDTIGAVREWDALKRLNGYLRGALTVTGTEPRLDWRRSFEMFGCKYVDYKIPLSSHKFHALVVWDTAYALLTTDSNHVISPVPLDLFPNGAYVCLD